MQLYKQNPCCALCGKHIEDIKDAEVDHVVPHSKGGRTVPSNAQLLCMPCNRRKGNKQGLTEVVAEW